MHFVCILFAQCVLKVCISRLSAHFVWLHYWVCRLFAHIICMKCAYADLVYTIVSCKLGVQIVYTNRMHKVCICRLGTYILPGA